MAKNKNNYFQHRSKLLKFDPEKDFGYIDFHPDEPMGAPVKKPMMWEGKKGEICLGILDLNREFVTTDTRASTRKYLSGIKIEPLYTKRKVPGAPGPKYLPGIDKMGVWPYLMPNVCDLYQQGKEIDTLFFTEGWFKAFALYKKGLPAIGLPGITVWKQKTEKELFFYIRAVLEKCKVKNAIYITDADTFKVEWGPDKDLFQRPNTFYTSIKMYKKLFTDHKVALIWKAMKENEDLGKGIDDALIEAPSSIRREIIEELKSKKPVGEYFETYLVDAMTYTGIKEAFGIDKVEKFYRRYEFEIGLREFIFNRAQYQYDDLEGKLRQLKSQYSSNLIMIGSTIYKLAFKPSKSGAEESVLLPLKANQLEKICGSKGLATKVFHEIDYYDGAINIPSHHDYQKYVDVYDNQNNLTRWYNMYRPITHKPVAGECPVSMKMIKHIFGTEQIPYKGDVISSYELGLDYMKLLWQMPQHILPILTLYSIERQTGKTTFWNWMRAIFQQNVKSVRPEHLTGQFTSFFAGALFVVVDEALIERKATMERIKGLVTAEKGTIEGKFTNAEEIDNFVKVGMATNNQNFASIDDDEIRFWIRKVPSIEEQIFDIDEKLNKEIPAFLKFLEDRDFTTQKSCRAWFDPNLLVTQELQKIKKESKWKIEKEIDEAMINYFAMAKVPQVGLSTRDLKKLVDNHQNTNSDYRNILENRMHKTKKNYTQKYVLYDYNSAVNEISRINKDGLPYFFTINEFLDFETICRTLNYKDILSLEIEHEQVIWPEKISDIEIQALCSLDVFEGVEDIVNLSKVARKATSFEEFISKAMKEPDWIKE